MHSALHKNKTLISDAVAWLVAMIVLSGVAFFLLSREARKQYGTVAFGNFPEFTASAGNGKSFDHHKLHGQLSAIIVAEKEIPHATINYLHKLSRATAGGKKYLHNLILTDAHAGVSDQWVQYLFLSTDQLSQIRNWKDSLFKQGIILVDQNGIIRGVFDLEDKLDRINFEGAVRGIL